MTLRQVNPAGTFYVALTGGIASGKSATADRFVRLGVDVFDADKVARDVVAPGQPGLTEIASTFGAEFLTATGELDRTRMRTRVFADASERKRLEALLHPRIRQQLIDQARACTQPYCILAIPLYVEVQRDYAWIDRILVTDVPPEVQLARLTRRPGIDAHIATEILASQAARSERFALAHDIIDNTGPLEKLDIVVERLHRRYLQIASARDT